MTEAQYMPKAAEAWHNRCQALGLKPGTKGRQRELEAFLQGALAVATATGNMTMQRAHMLGFLVSVGRGEEILKLPEEAQP